MLASALASAIATILLAQSPDSLRRGVDQAVAMQKQGDASGAQRQLQSLLPRLRQSGDTQSLARALAASSEAALTIGDYRGAVALSREALDAHALLKDDERRAEDYNRIGLANVYTGDYNASITAYESALAIDRQRKDAEGEIVRLYNIGNVYYEQGRYQQAYRSYQESLDRTAGFTGEPWYARRHQIVVANLAILNQRLGRYRQALDLYLSLEPQSASLPPRERAQLLANKGTLYRRLGDPPKALETYREAEKLFSQDRHPFGEVGVLKNIGIAFALDLDRMPEALDAFARARTLAATSAKSQLPSIRLYLAQTLHRLGRTEDARTEYRAALESARSLGSKDYSWRATFGLGQLAAAAGSNDEALRLYLDSIRTFESMRSGIDMVALKREFLADKREVYDAALSLLLEMPEPPLEQLLQLMENSRSRIFQDSLPTEQSKPGLRTLQDRLEPGTVLLEFWNGSTGGAVLSLTRSTVQLAKRPPIEIARLREALRDPERKDWRALSSEFGTTLLGDLTALRDPSLRNVVVIPDGALALVPFEALTVNGRLLIESAPVFYAPSAGVLLRPSWGGSKAWKLPWSNQVLAFADPAVGTTGRALFEAANQEEFARLPKSLDEARFIVGEAVGRTQLQTGENAQKRFLLAAMDRNFSTLHLATHATADYTDPERSRILLAPEKLRERADFLFLREIYSMNFKPFDLVVLSACDTETGKLVKGEGIEGFGKAFITAGAASAVTTLWRIDDRATAQFMQQFYSQLGSGNSKAAALREAKLKFLRSGSGLAHPAYWAGFVLNGDGLSPATRFISWWAILSALAALLLAALVLARSRRLRVM